MTVLPPTTIPEAAALTGCALLFPLIDKLVAKGVLDHDDITNIVGTAQIGLSAHFTKPHGTDAANLIAYVSRSLHGG